MLIMCKGKNFIYFSHLKQCKTIFKRKGKEASLFIGRHNNSPIRYLNREKQEFFISTYQPPVHRISTQDSHTYVSPVTSCTAHWHTDSCCDGRRFTFKRYDFSNVKTGLLSLKDGTFKNKRPVFFSRCLPNLKAVPIGLPPGAYGTFVKTCHHKGITFK